MGAGTRSLAVLAMLTLIMRRRKRGILALEEPETFLFPHAQRRVIDECMGLADQLFITTHSPYVLERVPVEGVGRIIRQPDGEVTWAPLNAADARQVNLFSRYLRHGVSEALLGRGVIIVEGLSDKWWINGANRILHRNIFNGRTQEAFELQGVSIVSSESNSQAIRFGKFFFEAGLRVVCILDKDKAVALNKEVSEAPFPTLVLKQKGLEDLLSQQLPLDLVRRILTSAPHCKSTPLTEAAALALLEPAARTACRDLLIDNKGSAAMHEWIIDQLNEATLPPTLAIIADRVGYYLRGVENFNTHSLLT
jgi:putative ATP-dependent endonuclease of OLD family